MLPARAGCCWVWEGLLLGFESIQRFFFPIIYLHSECCLTPKPPAHAKRFLQGYEMFLRRESFQQANSLVR